MAHTMRTRFNWLVNFVFDNSLTQSGEGNLNAHIRGCPVDRHVIHCHVVHRRRVRGDIARVHAFHVHPVHRHAIHLHNVYSHGFMPRGMTVLVTGILCKTTSTSEHARTKRCSQHVTETGQYEQQCKTGWKESLHLSK